MNTKETQALWKKYAADRNRRMKIQYNLAVMNAQCEELIKDCQEKVAQIRA